METMLGTPKHMSIPELLLAIQGLPFSQLMQEVMNVLT